MRAANRERDFEAGRDKSKRLHKLIQTNEKDAIASATRQLGTQIAAERSEYKSIVKRLESEFKQREDDLREMVDDSFTDLQNRQLQLLTELELFHKQETVRAAKRETANVVSLQRVSVYLADQEEFDKAISISKEAVELQRTETGERQRDLDTRVALLSRGLLAKFEKEIRLLEERLTKGLQGIQEQLADEVQAQQKQLSVTIQRITLDAIHQANRQIKKKERESEVSTRITDFARTTVREFGMSRNLAFEQVE
jgi:hypothetical protein